VPVNVTRRTLFASALMAAVPLRGLSAQELGKIERESILSLVPTLPGSRAAWPLSILTYADIAGYCEAAGIEKPGPLSAETTKAWTEISQRLPINDDLVFLHMALSWDDLTGFNPWEIDRLAIAFDPPGQLRIYQGTIDSERVADRFTTEWGFTSHTTGEFTVLTTPDDDLDLENELDRLGLGNLDHVAVSKSLLIASRSAEVLEEALAIHAGDAAAFGEDQAFTELAKLVADVSGYVVISGAALAYDLILFNPRLSMEEIKRLRDMVETFGSVPPARWLTIGLTLEKQKPVVVFLLDLGSPDAAMSAIPVVEQRIAAMSSRLSNVSYSELMIGAKVDHVSGTGILRVRVSSEEFARHWMHMAYASDLIFLATE
jgi:hypothetical protein